MDAETITMAQLIDIANGKTPIDEDDLAEPDFRLLRCGRCNRGLLEVLKGSTGMVQAKCDRCGVMNTIPLD